MSFIEQWLHDAVPALVGGQWRKGQQTFAVDNPATGETIAHVADLSADDTRDAVFSSKLDVFHALDAFQVKWQLAVLAVPGNLIPRLKGKVSDVFLGCSKRCPLLTTFGSM